MSKCRMLFVAFISAVFWGCTTLVPTQLVSVDDYTVPNDAQDVFSRSAGIAGGPKINILKPLSTDRVASPTAIIIEFKASPGSRVRPDTFKLVLEFGPFRKDITERVLKSYRPTEAGLFIESASIPAGVHRFTMSVEDNLNRTGSTRLEVHVES